jgi:hypothetical protein
VSYRVEIVEQPGLKRALISLDSESFARFIVVVPALGWPWGIAAKLIGFRDRAHVDFVVYLDAQGEVIPYTQGEPPEPGDYPHENFGWLLDIAQEAGLDFPALHGG